MKCALLFLLLCAIPAHAQSVRALGGLTATANWDNYNAGATAGIEVPFLNHFEFDLQDAFAPVEQHVALGHGRANLAMASGIGWFSNQWGITGSVEDSAYDVTAVTKDADYALLGAIWRRTVGGYPARFTFQYLRQFNNGITPSGLESSHMQGADFGMMVRVGCAGAVCFRFNEDVNIGQVWTQGNPQCDGSFGGPVTCQRGKALGGGFDVAFLVEFPRPRGHEYEPF